MSSVDTVIYLFAYGLFCVAAGSVVTYKAVHWGMDRQAEVDRVRKDEAVAAAMQTAFELEKHTSGEQPAVEEDPEPPKWMDQSGYRAPRDGEFSASAHTCEWSDDGFTECGELAEGFVNDALDGEPVWMCADHYQWACHGGEDLQQWADAVHTPELEGEGQFEGPRALPHGRMD